MSTEIETKMQDHTMARFRGHRGACVQITAARFRVTGPVGGIMQPERFIQLTLAEAAALRDALAAFIADEGGASD